MHGYSIPAAEALDFVRRLRRLAAANIAGRYRGRGRSAPAAAGLRGAGAGIHHPRRKAEDHRVLDLSACAKACCTRCCRRPSAPRTGLICAAQTLNELLSRSARHAEELIVWTDRFVRVARLKETAEDERLRHAACLLSDIGWRVHPDYRGEQTLNLITNGNFGAVGHQGRAFLALSVFYRYAGLSAENEPPAIDSRAGAAGAGRARAGARRGVPRGASDLGGAAGRAARDAISQPGPQADAGVRAPHGRSRRRPRRQPLQATGAAGRTKRERSCGTSPAAPP